jgi:glucose-1-phosphate thymidylyltransferase
MKSELRVVIPAAGGGTRLKPHTNTLPKVLLPVAGKPILGHIVDLVAEVNPQEVIVVVGAQGELIEEYLRDAFKLNFRFAVQSEPKGLGHAVAQARDSAYGFPTLVLLGDTILDLDLSHAVAGGNLLGVRVVDDPRRFGVVELKNGIVASVVEKPAEPKSNLAIVGVYYFEDSRPLFDALEENIRLDRKTRGEYQLTDALQLMVQRGVAIKPLTVEHWLDCGTRDTLLETNAYLLRSRHHAPDRPGVVVIPPVFIDDRAQIEHSVIGPNVAIGAYTVVRNSVISDSIINGDTVVENAVLEHSILGSASKFLARPQRLNLGGSSEMVE